MQHECRNGRRNFPQVRAYYLAKYLSRLGLAADYRTFPCEALESRIIISTEYQGDMAYFGRIQKHLLRIKAERMYCVTDHGLAAGNSPYKPMNEWFASRGGVLTHMAFAPMAPYEHYIGLGVDPEVVRFVPGEVRNRFIFDFPSGADFDAAAGFTPSVLASLRLHFPLCRFVGSGSADSSVRPYFDEWVPYGQDHGEYVRVYQGCAAFVPTMQECMGLTSAEAQVSGACIVAPREFVRDEMVCAAADKRYVGGSAELVQALRAALDSDGSLIAEQARARFDILSMARRTAQAVGMWSAG